MKILFTASECVPFVKTGGLADVVGALAPVLAKEGHDVRVIMPLYAAIPEKYVEKMTHVCDFEVELGWRKQYCGIEMIEQDGVKWYFMDNKFYFGRPYIYGMGGDEYERFGFFCRASLNFLPIIDFQPDVIHAHDWQSGMVPALLKIQYAHLPFFANIKTMYTIHNLQYQGVFGINQVKDILGLGDSLWTDDKLECYGCANFMKAALVYADLITTVSPSYSEEIQTAYYGERLDGLLRARKEQVFGVLNGIDMVDYDPTIDARIEKTYSASDLSGKAACKAALQEKLGLDVNPDTPIIGMVGRLSNQKGLDLVDSIIGDLMQQDVQLVVLGMGESRYVSMFTWAEDKYKGKVAARFAMDHALAHQIYAGCDMFLMPSQFEPCGLSQLIALRYGTVPIVRETGGLRDTVLSYNEFTGEGNGFSFFNYNAHDMLHVIERAMDYYKNHKDVWSLLQQRGMTGDYSWTNSAGKYVDLYKQLVGDAAVEAAPAVEAEAAPAPVKAKKPAAPRKKKADDPEAVKKPRRACAKKADAAEGAEEKAEKPKRTRKKAAPAEAVETAEVTAPAEEKPKKPRAPRKKKTEE
ncbi:MAG: glycogen synthase GlgA [Clostridia bacterium]|nr:glycogen synthase GlgA [Clostridia bacterium]